MKLFRVMNRFTQVLAVAFTLAGVAAHASSEFVQADISPGTVTAITPTINASLGAAIGELRKNKGADTCYFLAPNEASTYHVTLDNIERKDGRKLTTADHVAIVDLIGKFKAKRAEKNDHGKSYKGEGFELRLYVHYADGRVQHYAMKPSEKVKDIRELAVYNTPISYANLVIKHGTNGALKKDWERFRVKCLDSNRTYKTKGEYPKLDTHITIGNLYKYTDAALAKKVAGQKAAFMPFSTRHDRDVLISAFSAACDKFKKLDPINVNRITVKGADKEDRVWLGKGKKK